MDGSLRRNILVHVPCPWLRLLQRLDTRYSFWRRTLSQNFLSCQISLVSSEELALPCFISCELSRLCCHGHSLLLSSFLCRIKRKNSSFSACGHPLQDLTLRCAIFGITSSIFDLWSRPWGVARL